MYVAPGHNGLKSKSIFGLQAMREPLKSDLHHSLVNSVAGSVSAQSLLQQQLSRLEIRYSFPAWGWPGDPLRHVALWLIAELKL